MTDSSTHVSLLDRLRDRPDAQAWDDFVARYRELMLRVALRRGLPIHDAEDVVQSSLARLARVLPNFVYRPELGQFRGYLRTIVQNEIRRAAARRARVAQPVDDAHFEALPVEPELAAAWEEEWEHHLLRLAYREVRREMSDDAVALFEALLAGETPTEIAARTGASIDSVYKTKQRVQARLKRCIDQQREREEFRERRTNT
jgi:RNA polymerase sigma-70 factor (ECF subfamily)